MKARVFLSTAAVTAFAFMLPTPAFAQWLDYPTAGIPRLPNGKPNLAAPAPKLADGKPDLSGLYDIDSGRLFQNIAADIKPDLPMQPWAAALAREREQENRKDDPYSHCMPPVVPRINSGNRPFKILQLPGLVVILYETGYIFRQIFTDGRPLPKDPQPAWLGYSVGKWEGDALVVDTIGFQDQGWLDGNKGHPHTGAMHVTERFRRLNFGRLEIEETIDDPKAYTKPFTVKHTMHLLADSEILENICNENEKDAAHLVGK
ncbi:MAG: hypothetical protein EXQ56_12985 [Acidobacteria bacterium]|nr:hypothetical protein [Acidobacteriota bacterium]